MVFGGRAGTVVGPVVVAGSDGPGGGIVVTAYSILRW